MLYLISEYASEYPYRNLQGLEKFKNYSKNLHEMSLSEINEIVSQWSPLNTRTAYNQKKQILHYFQWLQSKGEKVDTSIVDNIEIPISKKKFLIFSTKDIKLYYDILFEHLEKKSIINNTEFSKSPFYMCFAAGILSFYGLTAEQIINLNLSDISVNGVTGYDLPLTKEDIDVLMTYKNTTRLGRIPLLGNKYIRSTHFNTKIDSSYLSRPLWRLTLDSEHIYLRKLLGVNNLYWLGLYSRIYNIEQETGQMEFRCDTPKWFVDMLEISNAASISQRKKEYLEYRNEKNNYISSEESIEQDEIIENIIKEDIKKEINSTNNEKVLLDIIQNLTNEISSMKDEIRELKSNIK